MKGIGNDVSFKIEKWYFLLMAFDVTKITGEASHKIVVRLDWISLLEFCDDWISARKNLKRWFHFKLQALWFMHSFCSPEEWISPLSAPTFLTLLSVVMRSYMLGHSLNVEADRDVGNWLTEMLRKLIKLFALWRLPFLLSWVWFSHCKQQYFGIWLWGLLVSIFRNHPTILI